MAHITLPEGLPGISGPLRQFPVTAKPLLLLAETILRGPSSLTMGERETIAAFTSSRNQCRFCMMSHAAAARHHLDAEGADRRFVDAVIADGSDAASSPKMKALLAIAEKVQEGGKGVTAEMVAGARAEGADDDAIHLTVLIAAAFSMYNRYVDGLGTQQPDDIALYDQMGARLAEQGYVSEKR